MQCTFNLVLFFKCRKYGSQVGVQGQNPFLRNILLLNSMDFKKQTYSRKLLCSFYVLERIHASKKVKGNGQNMHCGGLISDCWTDLGPVNDWVTGGISSINYHGLMFTLSRLLLMINSVVVWFLYGEYHHIFSVYSFSYHCY